jgi:hypothetical protein
MKTIRYISCSGALLIAMTTVNCALAQDTSKRKTIDITSTFKPVLRDAVKQNFSASLPTTDTSRPLLNYNIPQQQVKVPFSPGTLNPVALQVDSLLPWSNSHFLKVGVGNAHLPYAQGAFSFGNGTTSFFTAYGEVYASKGKLDHQKNNLADFMLRGTFKVAKDHELSARLGFKGQEFYYYGYRPDTLEFSKSELRQRFRTVEAAVNFRNTSPSEFGLTYNPNAKVIVFSGTNNSMENKEENLVFNLPLQKNVGKSFGFNLGFTADLTRYTPEGKSRQNNDLMFISPALLLKTPNVFLNLGVTPSWDNGSFNMLPNLMGEMTTNDQRFTLQAGWIGYYNKGSYQRFSTINPWIAPPADLQNHRQTQLYVGFKGSLANHFTYSAKASFFKEHHVPLFVNDQVDGKTFETVYANSMDVLQFHGEIGYMRGEDFSFSSGITFNNFTNVEGQAKAWGLLPVELNGTLRWKILKDLYFKTDLYAWDGAAYRSKEGDDRKGDKAFDLNAGVEFRITRGLNLWLQMNNIFNNRYQRWNQYEVYGFNFLGGVAFRFGDMKPIKK